METNYQKWLWEKLAQKCIENLKKHGFEAHSVPTVESACSLMMEIVSGYESFGVGGSDTIRKIGILEKLKQSGKTIYDHWQNGLSPEEDMNIRRQQLLSDCFFCSANAIAATGEIINVDGIGNRTSAMTFGPQRVIIAAGMNKITPDLESALRRIRDIAAPMRAKSLGMDTPCAKTGFCSDCHTPQRICRITTILHRKPMKTEVSVILIHQRVGF